MRAGKLNNKTLLGCGDLNGKIAPSTADSMQLKIMLILKIADRTNRSARSDPKQRDHRTGGSVVQIIRGQ